MVVFIDHEDDLEHTPGSPIDLDLNRVLKARNAESLLRMHALPGRDGTTTDSSRRTTTSSNSSRNEIETESQNQNLNLNVDHGFSAALSCYPYANDSFLELELSCSTLTDLFSFPPFPHAFCGSIACSEQSSEY